MYFNISYDRQDMQSFAKDILRAVDCVDDNAKLTSPAKLKMFAELLSEADSCEIRKLDIQCI